MEMSVAVAGVYNTTQSSASTQHCSTSFVIKMIYEDALLFNWNYSKERLFSGLIVHTLKQDSPLQHSHVSCSFIVRFRRHEEVTAQPVTTNLDNKLCCDRGESAVSWR